MSRMVAPEAPIWLQVASSRRYIWLGWTGLGDVTGDGIGDLFVFSGRNDSLGIDVGRPYLISGNQKRPHINLPVRQLARVGRDVSLLSDLNGDGLEALVAHLMPTAVPSRPTQTTPVQQPSMRGVPRASLSHGKHRELSRPLEQ